LIVFLPGIGDLGEDFAARGFIGAAAKSDLDADAIAVDAHFGYYARRSVIDRLAHDIVLPARRRGYRDIWLIGISMGGAGALAYAAHHPAHVDRVLLLAPYLGDAKLVREMTDAAQPPNAKAARIDDDPMRRLWHWMETSAARDVFAKLYLGYGTRDRFAKANALLASRLPPKHVIAITGGHGWRTWTRLWDAFIAEWTDAERRVSALQVE